MNTRRHGLRLVTAGCLLLVAVAGSLTACSSASALDDPPPAHPSSTIDTRAQICQTASDAYAQFSATRDANSAVPGIRKIIQTNLDNASASALFFQVSQLADAYRGALDLANDPELGNGASRALIASLQNLVAFCDNR